mgnify:CR=1 FL=1
MLLVTAGCSTAAPAPPAVEVSPLEVRWGETGAWQSVPTLRDQPPGRGSANLLEARFTLPSVDCVDPAVLLTTCAYLVSARVGGREAPFHGCLIPVSPEEVGRVVELRLESTQLLREGDVQVGCHAALRRAESRSDLGALWVAFALIVTGVALTLLALRGGSEALVLGSGALFCVSVGVLTLQQTAPSHEVSPVPLPVLRAARDVAAFVYPGAFAAFVGFAVPARGRWLFWVSALMAVALLAALVGDLASVQSLRASARWASLLTLGVIAAVLVHLVRNARSDAGARTLLFGFAVTVAFAVPDVLWGVLGRPLLPTNVGHFGLVALAGTMALVLQDRFRARARAVAQRVADIEQLNQELRFQVENRSRELRTALAAEPPAAPRDAVSGEVIAGRYRVDALLGEGGMARVYRVTRLLDGRALALKLMSRGGTRVDAARFAREGELAARLDHPNLVPVVDVGRVEGGPLYLVMELVEGDSLDRLGSKWGDTQWALPVLSGVARGLEAVHAAGIVHRDVKPSNVLLSNGLARLSDFGVARPEPEGGPPDPDSTATRDGTKLTQTGAMVGTPRYMAPEVARGDGATRASDVYSFGLMFAQVLTGEYPLVEPPYVAVLAGRPLERAPLPRLPEHLRGLVDRMLAELPAERPTMAEVRAALG